MIDNRTLRQKIAKLPKLKSATAYKILLTLVNEIMNNGGQTTMTKTALANKVGIKLQHVNRDLNPLIKDNLITTEGEHTIHLKYSLGSYFDED